MLKVLVTAPVTLPAGTRLHKLAPELLDDRRHLVKALGGDRHVLAKPTTFSAGDELVIDGDVLGTARAALATVEGKETVPLGVYYARRDDEASRAAAKAAAPVKKLL